MKRNGFSRWEFLALGAVASVVGALLLPVLAKSDINQNAASQARTNTCINNLKQVSLGIMQYTQDYDEQYPIVISTSGSPNGVQPYGWGDALQPYIRNTQIYQCPSERHGRKNDPRLPRYTDYWYNANLSATPQILLRAPIVNLMLGDGDGGSANSNARYHINSLPQSWIKTPNSPARRHMNRGCYAFADGHVEQLDAKEVGSKIATFTLR